ncbi:hypothetical protein [Bacillus altitudinis]|uniref:hypothetical protein n=1 Tax=Bacillus altitudinis TaxID=293387 RepID=UPI001459AA4B|nr:hypothetical protein [Bacillus altitudinis]NMF16609.1 hypothetical protein [Bacillus altitudinis]
MRKLNKNILISFSVFFLMFLIPSPTSFATNSTKEKENYYVEEFKVLLNDENEKFMKDSVVSSKAVIKFPPEKWTIKGKKYTGETIGKKVLWKTSGQPGILVSLSKSFSVNAGVTATFGMPIKEMNAQIGFTINKTVTVTNTGSYKVPKKHKGKKVKRATVTAYALYNNWSYKVYYTGILALKSNEYKGTGRAYKPVGIYFTKKIYYK